MNSSSRTLLAQLFIAGALLCVRIGLPEDRPVPELPPEGERIRVIVDTDAANEIDDQYALALAVLSLERLEIEGFVAAHFGDSGGPKGVEKSFQEITTVLQKAGLAGKFPVKRGSHPLQYSKVPQESEGVDFIIERALAEGQDGPLWIVSLGPCTDIVSAYLKKPEIKNKIVAFWHGRTQWPKKAWNFNAYNDLKAVRVLLTSDLPVVLFDTGTHLYCPMSESKQNVSPYGALGKYLHDFRYRKKWYQSSTKGFFDLGDIAALVDPSLARMEVVEAPGVNWDMAYDWKRTWGKILRIYDIDRDRTFELLYRKLSDAYPRSREGR